MRHYVPHKNNPYALPHNLYMQMLYLIRDYYDGGKTLKTVISDERLWQWQGVSRAAEMLLNEYKKRPETNGAFKPLQAFFDYAYFSLMFAQAKRDMGAGKRSWNLYRCRFAYLVAKFLGLYVSETDNHPDG